MPPTTVKEAATLILSQMSGREKLLLRNTRKEYLIKFHLSWGNEIRNRCGLWDGNDDLIRDAGTSHPDSVSMKIMEMIWDELHKE